jgi:hypothetical protein
MRPSQPWWFDLLSCTTTHWLMLSRTRGGQYSPATSAGRGLRCKEVLPGFTCPVAEVFPAQHAPPGG